MIPAPQKSGILSWMGLGCFNKPLASLMECLWAQHFHFTLFYP
jgi:hypothetical protein